MTQAMMKTALLRIASLRWLLLACCIAPACYAADTLDGGDDAALYYDIAN